MHDMILVPLPAADLARSRAFYAGLGYAFDERFGDPSTVLVELSPSTELMLSNRDGATSGPRRAGPAVVLSMVSREAVDTWMDCALAHGGVDDGRVQKQGDFMYGRSASDPDGNVIEVTWVDVDAAMRAWGADA